MEMGSDQIGPQRPGGGHPSRKHGHGGSFEGRRQARRDAPIGRPVSRYKAGRCRDFRAQSRVLSAGSAPARIVTCRIRASGVVGFGSLGVHFALRKTGSRGRPFFAGAARPSPSRRGRHVRWTITRPACTRSCTGDGIDCRDAGRLMRWTGRFWSAASPLPACTGTWLRYLGAYKGPRQLHVRCGFLTSARPLTSWTVGHMIWDTASPAMFRHTIDPCTAQVPGTKHSDALIFHVVYENRGKCYRCQLG
ncbi:hypothetical protein ACQKWADRAFT_289241 [Trichoderma austrokoningii]